MITTMARARLVGEGGFESGLQLGWKESEKTIVEVRDTELTR